jgi:integrase/recombinase XerD
MSRLSSRGLFAQVEAYFTEFLPRQRGASVHTIRAYRDALTLLFKFVAKHQSRGVHSLQLNDLDADMVTRFLDHIELRAVELGGHTQLPPGGDPRLLQALASQ